MKIVKNFSKIDTSTREISLLRHYCIIKWLLFCYRSFFHKREWTIIGPLDHLRYINTFRILCAHLFLFPGWGKTRHPGGMTNVLQQAAMPVVDNKVCYAKNRRFIPIPVSTLIRFFKGQQDPFIRRGWAKFGTQSKDWFTCQNILSICILE